MRTSVMIDTPERYGLLTRCLHWATAYLLLWQFLTLLGWRLIGDGPFMRTASLFGPYHGTVGMLVLALLLPRLIWTLVNRRRRPLAGRGGRSSLARAVHAVFYLLMLVVPGLALVRAYANGRGFELWGLQLVAETGQEIAWLTVPADLLHGPLAWTLATLIAGHVLMALIHGNRSLSRMAGRFRSVPASDG